MKTLYFSLIFILATQLGVSQIYEFGIIGGGVNVVGDVGSTTFVAPKKLAIGGIVRWNRSPRHSYRASVLYTTLFGNDYLSSDPKRELRGYTFNARSLEVSAGIEFTFLDFDLHRRSFNFSPYIFTGFSMLNHPNFYFNNNKLVSEKALTTCPFNINAPAEPEADNLIKFLLFIRQVELIGLIFLRPGQSIK